MTEEDEEFERIQREIDMHRANCQHRWVETNFGKEHREPGTYTYECQRCHLTSMTQLTTESSK